MDAIEINTGPQNLSELRKRVTPFRPPSLVRRQVARDDVGTKIASKTWCIETRGQRWTEVRTPFQIGRRVGLRGLAKVGVPSCGVVEVWRSTAGVATIAVATALTR